MRSASSTCRVGERSSVAPGGTLPCQSGPATSTRAALPSPTPLPAMCSACIHWLCSATLNQRRFIAGQATSMASRSRSSQAKEASVSASSTSGWRGSPAAGRRRACQKLLAGTRWPAGLAAPDIRWRNISPTSSG